MKPGYIRRFSKTERAIHWVNALGFFFLLVTGLILYLPVLSVAVGRRQFIQEIHFWGGVGWVSSLLIVAVLGDRRGLLRTARELDVFEREDVNWLTHRVPRGQARFNAGQKLNFALVCVLLVAFYVSGVDTIVAGTHHNLIFGGHKLGTIAICVLVAGHLYMALVNPTTRAALSGMLTGKVDREWARRHYPRWKP